MLEIIHFNSEKQGMTQLLFVKSFYHLKVMKKYIRIEFDIKQNTSFNICYDYVISQTKFQQYQNIKYTCEQQLINNDINSMAIKSLFFYSALTYTCASITLFLCPRLLHNKKRAFVPYAQTLSNNKILRVAHRGGARITAQNTIQAFKKIFHISDVLQMDICQTKDGVLIVHHDKNLLRTCGIDKNIQDCNHSQIPCIQDEIQVDFATETKLTTNNQKIPTLEDIFKIFQGVPMNIQLKTPTKTAIKQFARLIRQYNRQEITICGVGNELQKQFSQQNPDLFFFMNKIQMFKILFAYYTGLLPFLSINCDSLQIPLYTEDFRQTQLRVLKGKMAPWKINILFTLLKLQNLTIGPLVWHLKQRGIPTLIWVCNSQQQFQRALRLSPASIITDTPFQLDKYLKDKNLI